MPSIHRLAAAVFAVTLLPFSASHAQADVCAASKSMKAAGSTPSAVTPAEVRRVLSVLANDSLEGRGTATRGGAKAARFIAEEFKAAGLEPAGDSGYFQRVPVIFANRGGRIGVSAVPSFAKIT